MIRSLADRTFQLSAELRVVDLPVPIQVQRRHHDLDRVVLDAEAPQPDAQLIGAQRAVVVHVCLTWVLLLKICDSEGVHFSGYLSTLVSGLSSAKCTSIYRSGVV